MLLVPKWVCSPMATSGWVCSRSVARHSGDGALHSSHTRRNNTMSCSRELKSSSRGGNGDWQFQDVAQGTALAQLDAHGAVSMRSGSMSDFDWNSLEQEMGKEPQRRVAVVGSTQQKGGSAGKDCVWIKCGVLHFVSEPRHQGWVWTQSVPGDAHRNSFMSHLHFL